MKKSISFILSIALVLCLLVGCSARYDTHIIDGCYISTYDYEHQEILIRDYDELQNYLESLSVEDCGNDVQELLLSYGADFFEDEMLVIIYYVDSTTSSTISIDNVNISDGCVDVTIKSKVPEVGTCALKSCLLLAEIPQNDTVTSVKYTVDSVTVG